MADGQEREVVARAIFESIMGDDWEKDAIQDQWLKVADRVLAALAVREGPTEKEYESVGNEDLLAGDVIQIWMCIENDDWDWESRTVVSVETDRLVFREGTREYTVDPTGNAGRRMRRKRIAAREEPVGDGSVIIPPTVAERFLRQAGIEEYRGRYVDRRTGGLISVSRVAAVVAAIDRAAREDTERPDGKILDLGGPDGGRYWRVVSDHAVDDPDVRSAAIHAGVTGSVGCTYNGAKVERVVRNIEQGSSR